MDFIVMGMSLMRFGGITAANWKNAVSLSSILSETIAFLINCLTTRKITT
ncbi:MAG: hypothetical protein WBQ05_07785 [Candidatus Competibacter denitrificans]